MAIELHDGTYARVKIWDKRLLEGISSNKQNKSRVKLLGGNRANFLILPYTYFSYVVPASNKEEEEKDKY